MCNKKEYKFNFMITMKKILFFAMTLLFATQMMFADGARDIQRDTFGKCDEQYYSVIKLKIKRPEAIPFTINARGGKVEFSTGNLQYQAKTKTFRLATRQWEVVGVDADESYSTLVMWDSVTIEWNATANKYDTLHHIVPSNNKYAAKDYGGWIDCFPWGTSTFKRSEVDNKDGYVTCIYPYNRSVSELPSPGNQNNTYGYGPSANVPDVAPDFDLSDPVSCYYDWGINNDIYCIWVGYDTTKAPGNTGKDTILFDSTMFQKGTWRTLRDTEWRYMLQTRKVENRTQTAWTLVKLQGAAAADFANFGGGTDPRALKAGAEVCGMLIFPDEFELSNATKLGFTGNLTYGTTGWNQTLSYKNFMALEKLGVIFLPQSTTWNEQGNYETTKAMTYWTSTHYESNSEKGKRAYYLRFTTTGTIDGANGGLINYQWGHRCRGMQVRLVRDLNTKLEQPVSAYF